MQIANVLSAVAALDTPTLRSVQRIVFTARRCATAAQRSRAMSACYALALVVLWGCGYKDSDPAPPPITSPASAGLVEEMLAIPGGEFLGRPIHCAPGVILSPPPHELLSAKAKLTVDAYAIDRRLATCQDYARCREAGACSEPWSWCGRSSLRGDVVAWMRGATEYCAWRGARLVSYAQWQRAVRSTDGRLAPDGRDLVNASDVLCSGYGTCQFTSPEGIEYSVGEAELTSDTECDREGRVGPLTVIPLPLSSIMVTPFAEYKSSGRVRCARELTD